MSNNTFNLISISLQVMSHFIPHVEVTQTVGPGSRRATDRTFDDLSEVGGWPTSQNITGFHQLEIYANSDRVLGLRITYKFGGEQLQTLFSEAGTIIKIGFIVFNADPSANPPIEVKGPYGSTNLSKSSFGCYGNIIAFVGLDSDEDNFRAIGFVKSGGASPQGLAK
ncbi:hypothetical protein BJV74DRAFT_882325 [Russula compacta]|nr:hypothetical protein BJV74DRAFT_882325 [Russula compacta]